MKRTQTKALTVRAENPGAAVQIIPARMVNGGATDSRVVELWLQGKSPNTRRAYLAEILGSPGAPGRPGKIGFLPFTGKTLREITLEDLYAFAQTLNRLAPRSQARAVKSVKSLFTYANRIGFLPLNVGAPIQSPKEKETLAERILTIDEVRRLVSMAPTERDKTLLFLAYMTGGRVGEIAGLKWKDAQPRPDGGGQLTLFGKGGKTRAVLLPAPAWQRVLSMRGEAGPEEPVFKSQKGGHLDTSAILRIVKKAAALAGIKKPVSPHWLRHAHASHSLDNGAPIHLVQATLGHASVSTTGRYLHARPTESSSKYLNLDEVA